MRRLTVTSNFAAKVRRSVSLSRHETKCRLLADSLPVLRLPERVLVLLHLHVVRMQLQPVVGFLPAAIPGCPPRLEAAGVTAVDLPVVATPAHDERAPALRPAALDEDDEIQVV
jgi:hypothetical protein